MGTTLKKYETHYIEKIMRHITVGTALTKVIESIDCGNYTDKSIRHITVGTALKKVTET